MYQPTTIRPLTPVHHPDRAGISVIEVLAAMVVALIGVFGVLVLIPFSVKQAQLGLDQDAASLLAENAVDDLQIRGYASVDENGRMPFRGSRVWVGSDPDTSNPAQFNAATNVPAAEVAGVGNAQAAPPNHFPVLTPGLSIRNPRPFHFDPVAVASVGFPVSNYNAAQFPGYVGMPEFFNNQQLNPDFLTRNLPLARNDLRLTVATGISFRPQLPNGFRHLLGRAESRRLFRSHDDLIFGTPETDLLGNDLGDLEIPQPEFDRSGDGNILRRQSNDRLSWSAVFVPQKGATVKLLPNSDPTVTTRYKVYVLVYRDRSVLTSTTGDDVDSVMAAALVRRHNYGSVSVGGSVGGFVESVDQVVIESPVIDRSDNLGNSLVHKDDWVMLINRRPAPDYGLTALALSNRHPTPLPNFPERFAADEAGYDIQIGFAKVQSVRELASTPIATSLTLNGGAFNFYYTDVNDDSGNRYGVREDGDLTQPTGYRSDTYVIHLKNVITVYERTITLERNSVWN